MQILERELIKERGGKPSLFVFRSFLNSMSIRQILRKEKHKKPSETQLQKEKKICGLKIREETVISTWIQLPISELS